MTDTIWGGGGKVGLTRSGRGEGHTRGRKKFREIGLSMISFPRRRCGGNAALEVRGDENQ